MSKIKKYLGIAVAAVAVIAVWAFVVLDFNIFVDWQTAQEEKDIADSYDLKDVKSLSAVKSIDEISVGQRLKFGKYQQDGQRINGKEKILWRVLAIEDNKVLLISEKLLCYMPYHDKWEPVTWETCTLRKWLNEDFYKDAFGFFERERIALTTLDNSANAKYDTVSCSDTQDKIFVLSIDEALKYFEWDYDMSADATDYAMSQKEGFKFFASSEWWLRSMYRSEYYYLAATVSVFDGIEKCRLFTDSEDIAVRPAMWVEIN